MIREHDPEAHLSRAAQLGLAKLRAYSTKIREIPVYIAAVVLDPARSGIISIWELNKEIGLFAKFRQPRKLYNNYGKISIGLQPEVIYQAEMIHQQWGMRNQEP